MSNHKQIQTAARALLPGDVITLGYSEYRVLKAKNRLFSDYTTLLLDAADSKSGSRAFSVRVPKPYEFPTKSMSTKEWEETL